MHVLRVELEDIKRHRQATFDFERGTNAICGPNGAGKSTILEAIGFALFDHMPYRKEDFVRRGATTGIVRVTFESGLDGRPYTVVRNTKSQYHVLDPATRTKVAEQKTDVLAWLKAHLKLEPTVDLREFFQTTIGVPQGTFTAIFLEPPARRKTVFDRLLRVEEYREASDGLRDTVALVRERAAAHETAIAHAAGRLERLEPLERQHELLATQLAHTERQLAGLAREIGGFREVLTRLEGLEHERRAAREALDRHEVEFRLLTARLEDLERALAAARTARDERETLQGTVDRARALETERLDLESRLETWRKLGLEREATRVEQRGLEREHRDTLERITRLEGDAAEVTRLAPLAERQTWLETEITRLEPVRKAHDEAVRTLEREEAAQVARTRESDEHRAWVTACQAPADALDRLAAVRKDLDGLDAALADLNRREAEAASLAERRDQGLKRQQALAEQVTTLERDLTAALAAGPEAAQLNTWLERGQARKADQAAIAVERERLAATAARFRDGQVCPLLDTPCPLLEGTDATAHFADQDLDLARRHGSLEREIRELREAYRKSLEAQRLHDRRTDLEPRLNVARIELEQLERELGAPEPELADLRTRRGELDRERTRLTAERAQLEVAADEARERTRREERLTALATELAALETRIADLKAEGDRLLPDLEALARHRQERQDVGDVRRQLETHRREAAALPSSRERLTELDRAMRELAERLTDLDTRLATGDDLEATLTRTRQERDALETTLARARELEARATDLPDLELRFTGAGDAVAHAREACELARQNLGRLDTEVDPERLLATRERLETLVLEEVRLGEQCHFQRTQLEGVEAELTTLRALRESQAAQLQERERFARHLGFLEFARTALKEAATPITTSHVLHVSLEADRLFRAITGHDHVRLAWSADYEITLEEGGLERAFPSLSGGEQMAAALSVRLALLRELSGIDVAFLDEPTTNMDEMRRQNLAFQIGSLRSFTQLIVISHDDSFEQWTDHLLRVG
ncbi:MAG: SMC family ATPase [bacterium]|nr:SMC family ATPase [bacterium]